MRHSKHSLASAGVELRARPCPTFMRCACGSDEAPPEAEGRESLSGMYMNFIKTRMINANGAPAALSPVRTPTGRPYASARSQ
eukprot:1489961-Pleurochrysis_carterae.AAC.1